MKSFMRFQKITYGEKLDNIHNMMYTFISNKQFKYVKWISFIISL
jgi:hypothetical protein